MAKKKVEKEEVQLNVPEDFVGEVVGTVSKGAGEVAPFVVDFHDGELNLIRDKINEIIAAI